MEKRPKRSGGGKGGWIAALAIGAGVVAAVWFALGKRGRRRPLRKGEMRMAGSAGPPGDSTGALRESILGADKGMVQSVFGPPRSAGGGMAKVPDQGRQAYWEADTWYYSLDPKRRVALAITFREGVAREVEFLKGAEGPGVM